MLRRTHAWTVILAIAAMSSLSGEARAGVILDVAPPDAAPGDVLTISGSGLNRAGGVTAWLDVSYQTPRGTTRTRSFRLRVLDVTDEAVTVRVRNGRPGTGVVVLRGKRERRTTSTQITVALHAPAPVAVDFVTVSRGDPVTIPGAWFGTDRGSVVVGGRRARVETWEPNAVTFRVPRRLRPGLYGATVRTRFGDGVQPAVVRILGPPSVLRKGRGLAVSKRRGVQVYPLKGASYDPEGGFFNFTAKRSEKPRTYEVEVCGLVNYLIPFIPCREETRTFTASWGYRLSLAVTLPEGPGEVVVRDSDGLGGSIAYDTRRGHLKGRDIVDWTVILTRDTRGSIRGEYSGLRREDGQPVEGWLHVRVKP